METCSQCSREILTENTCHHLVRQGYSLEHFPILKYEKLPLCPDCHRRQSKVDIVEKVVAIVAIVIVLYFTVIGMLLLFGLVGEG